jgi:uncharacterized protein with HEPN domain
MSDDRLPAYLDHMRTAASDACNFIEGIDKVGFVSDKRTQQAVIMSLIILGEVATKVMDRYPEFATQNPLIPWRNIRGMRNRIALFLPLLRANALSLAVALVGSVIVTIAISALMLRLTHRGVDP